MAEFFPELHTLSGVFPVHVACHDGVTDTAQNLLARTSWSAAGYPSKVPSAPLTRITHAPS